MRRMFQWKEKRYVYDDVNDPELVMLCDTGETFRIIRDNKTSPSLGGINTFNGGIVYKILLSSIKINDKTTIAQAAADIGAAYATLFTPVEPSNS